MDNSFTDADTTKCTGLESWLFRGPPELVCVVCPTRRPGHHARLEVLVLSHADLVAIGAVGLTEVVSLLHVRARLHAGTYHSSGHCRFLPSDARYPVVLPVLVADLMRSPTCPCLISSYGAYDVARALGVARHSLALKSFVQPSTFAEHQELFYLVESVESGLALTASTPSSTPAIEYEAHLLRVRLEALGDELQDYFRSAAARQLVRLGIACFAVANQVASARPFLSEAVRQWAQLRPSAPAAEPSRFESNLELLLAKQLGRPDVLFLASKDRDSASSLDQLWATTLTPFFVKSAGPSMLVHAPDPVFALADASALRVRRINLLPGDTSDVVETAIGLFDPGSEYDTPEAALMAARRL